MCYWRVGSSCSTCDTWHVTLVTGPVISHKWGFVSFIVMKRTNFPLNHYIENKIPLIFNYYLQCYNKLTLRNKVDFYFFFSPMFYTFKKTSLFDKFIFLLIQQKHNDPFKVHVQRVSFYNKKCSLPLWGIKKKCQAYSNFIFSQWCLLYKKKIHMRCLFYYK